MRPGSPLPRLLAAALATALVAVSPPGAAGAGAAPESASAPSLVRHELAVSLDPERRTISVKDRVVFPGTPPSTLREVRFFLHAGLAPTVEPPAKLDEVALGGTVAEYRLALPAGVQEAIITYRGVIDHPLEQVGEEYARGQMETSGAITPGGVFLTRDSFWYPVTPEDRVAFTLEIDLPGEWDAVSQGRRAEHRVERDRRRVRWVADGPEREIHLVAGRWTETERQEGPVPASVFLREPDPALANRYLDATAQYVAMYADLIGPYPYPKWALVENFWETGYGMPSFTLLGPKVVRLPFIVNSSYPHEILHSWWGNAVGIDYEKGNWGEGLTAYLADHLVKEQGGGAAEYRQTTLAKYADYVLTGRDLPLTQFRSRHGSVTEAIGYGKSLMVFHMLRRDIGDDAFRAGLRHLYADWRGRTADWAALRAAFEKASGKDLAAFFAQWVERAGAPELKIIGAAETMTAPGAWRLTLSLAQMRAGEAVRPDDAYRLRVPVAVTLEGRAGAEVRYLEMDGPTGRLEADFSERPVRVDVDPEFDLFRRLAREEIPPSLSQAFGAERALIVIPSYVRPEVLAGYRKLAETLSHAGPGSVEIAEDTSFPVRSGPPVREGGIVTTTVEDPPALPAGRAIWVFGWENRFFPHVQRALMPFPMTFGAGDKLRLEQADVPVAGRSFVVAGRRPDDPALPLVWIATDNLAAMEGLGRKLPHYHKYSYLAFEGDEPANVAKGRWPLVGSPLSERLDRGPAGASMGHPPKRAALASSPSRYSKERLTATVRALAADELEGRGFGSPGLEKAADLIAGRFAKAGLGPGGEGGSFFQAFTAKGGLRAVEATLRNVVGVIAGSDPKLAGESVVIAAHYDHLGRGWPDAHKGDEGKVHPGADDNASGVAVLLELADALGRGWQPARTVVFAAFSGEEEGRLGSRRYVAPGGAYPVSSCRGMINLDTVGRLGAGKLLVLGGGSAPEWVHVFRGAGFLAGVDTVMATQGEEAGDHVSFREAGVPAVQIFTGPHADYHRPSDRPETIDADGLVKIAAVAKEALEYLATRELPLTPSGGAALSAGTGAAGSGRKISLGTIPDFVWAGEGMRLEGVTPGSPAEKAGLKAGDVVTSLAGKPILSLRDLSAILKILKAGDSVTVGYRRDGKDAAAQAVLEAR